MARRAQQRVDVSVRPAAAFRTQLDIARLDPGKKASVPNLRSMYDAYASRDASISTAPLVLSEGLSSYLVNFEHTCSEQLVSAAVPRVFAAKWLSVRALTSAMMRPTPVPTRRTWRRSRSSSGAARPAERTGRVRAGSATPDADPFVSAYAMHVLLDARERGIAVPKDMLDAGNQYLQKLAANDSLGSLDLLRQRAYAVYLLTRQQRDDQQPRGRAEAAAGCVSERLEERSRSRMACRVVPAAEAGQGGRGADRGPQALLERKRASDGGYVTGYLDPLTRDASVLYLIAKHFPSACASCRRARWTTSPRRSSTTATTRCRRR